MPSEKLTRILRSKSPFSAEQIEVMTDTEGWDWIYANASPRKKRLPSICFTGFSQAEKDALSALAIRARFRVVSSVSSSLAFLCAGEHAGPAKMTKARQVGIEVLDSTQFVNFLETGELPLFRREG